MLTAEPSQGVLGGAAGPVPLATWHSRSQDLEKPIGQQFLVLEKPEVCAAGAGQWRNQELQDPFERATPYQEEKLLPPLSLHYLLLTMLSILPGDHEGWIWSWKAID